MKTIYWENLVLAVVLGLGANVGKYRESQISSKNSSFGSYHLSIPLGALFQEMILRNPQALYILRKLEKFENSINIHFFYSRNCCKFHQFSRNQYKRGKDPIDYRCCTCIYQLPKALRLHKNVSQYNFCTIVLGFNFIVCTLIVCCFGGRNNAQLISQKVDSGMSQI